MKLKNLQDEIEVKNFDSATVIVKRKRREEKTPTFEKRDALDSVILNVSIAIGIFLLVASVNFFAGGFAREIPSMLGLS